MRGKYWFSLAFLLLLTGCQKKLQCFTNAELQFVNEATSGEMIRCAVQRVDRSSDAHPADGKMYLAFGTEVIAPPKTMSADQLDEVKRELIYASETGPPLPEYKKACMPQPGVIIRLHRQTNARDILLCFECRMLAFSVPGENDTGTWYNFDYANPGLAKLVRAAFPNDAAIQKINDKRHGPYE